MGIVKFSVTLLIVMALLMPNLTASGFENSGIGTQAMGMAGAFRAIADDWTAAYYNPAGYAFIKDNQLGANMAFFQLRDEINPDYRFGNTFETGIFNNHTDYNKNEILSNPSGGFVVKLPMGGKEIVLGLSAYQPFDNNISWKLFGLPLAYNDTLSVPKDQFTNNLDVVSFQLTASREFIEDKLSLGLGVQVLRGDLLFTNINFRNNPYPPPLSVRPWNKITEWSHNDGNGWGFGLNGGMLYKINEKLKFAITAQLPFDITIDGTTKFEFYMPKIPTLIENTDDPNLQEGTAGYLFASGSKVVDSADFHTKLKLPPSIALGVAYNITEDFTVSLDAAYTFWSRFDGFYFNYTHHRGLTGAADSATIARNFFTQNLANPLNWDDAGKIMLGARYKYQNLFTFLAGVSDDQSPIHNTSEINPQFIDTGDKVTVSGGVIWHYQQWDFGVSTSYTYYPDFSAPDMVDLNNDGLYDTFKGSYKASRYETVLSFNYRF